MSQMQLQFFYMKFTTIYSNEFFKNIILGSAKYGNSYGSFSNSKSINLEELQSIIKLSKQHGIKFIDTSKDYKNSEYIIGKLNIKNFNIITKYLK